MEVFISSSCYGSEDLRAELERYFKELGYNLLLSDRSNFPVHLSKHRHDVCIENVEKCDLFIVAILKRYGAPYYKDKNISITWAEFRRALNLNKNILALIREDIFTERLTYKNNKDNDNFKPVYTDNTRTFDFIDEIQKHEKGIWIERFKNSVQAKERLQNLYETNNSIINTNYYTGDTPSLILSSSAITFINNYVNNGTGNIDEDNIKKAIDLIPDGALLWGEIMGFDEMPESSDYYYSSIMSKTEEGGMWIALHPTALGKAIRKELIEKIGNKNNTKDK